MGIRSTILPLQNRRFSAIFSTSIKTAELKQKLIPCPQGFSIVAPFLAKTFAIDCDHFTRYRKLPPNLVKVCWLL